MPAPLAALRRPSGLIVLAGGTYDQQISHRELQAWGAPHAEAHSRRYATISYLFSPQTHAGIPPLMAVSDRTTIIDVGGTPFVWRLTHCDPSVTIVNLKAQWPIDGNRVVLASGLALPFRDRAFDV